MIHPVIIAAILLTALTPADARDGAWQIGDNQIHVYYGDLDAQTTAGRAGILGRVEQAARRICRNQYPDLNFRRACVRATVSDTAALPGQRALASALHERGDPQLAAR